MFAWFQPAAPGWLSDVRTDDSPSGLLTMGVALIPIMFAYGGWQQTNYVAEEIKDPERQLPRALIFGTLAVVAIYLLANVAYLRTLGLEGLAGTKTPAADTAGRWLGANGERFVGAAIAISTFGFLNLAILAASRVYYAMAADGAFLPALARLHPRFQTPTTSIVLQSSIAVIWTLTGEYGALLDSVVFADWIFFGLTVAGLFVLRPRLRRSPGLSHAGLSLAARRSSCWSSIVVVAQRRLRRARRGRRSAPDCCCSEFLSTTSSPRRTAWGRWALGLASDMDLELPLAPYLLLGEDPTASRHRSRRQQSAPLHARRSAGRS